MKTLTPFGEAQERARKELNSRIAHVSRVQTVKLDTLKPGQPVILANGIRARMEERIDPAQVTVSVCGDRIAVKASDVAWVRVGAFLLQVEQ